MANILGIDYGTVRIGLAVARGPLAEPLAIIANNQQTISKLQVICQQENIELLVVGISEGKMAEQTKEFVSELTKVVNVPVEFTDETLSSYEMHINRRNINKNDRYIDHLVAAQLLQNWLDEN